MAKRTIKTIDDARVAMLERLPAGFDLFVDVYWHDSRSRGHWHQTVRMGAAVWSASTELFRVHAPTAADLYRSFCFAFNEYLQPRRLTGEKKSGRGQRSDSQTQRRSTCLSSVALSSAALSPTGRARLSDEHDGVASAKRISVVEARVEARRICGPST